jgi:hypothetical protein
VDCFTVYFLLMKTNPNVHEAAGTCLKLEPVAVAANSYFPSPPADSYRTIGLDEERPGNTSKKPGKSLS